MPLKKGIFCYRKSRRTYEYSQTLEKDFIVFYRPLLG